MIIVEGPDGAGKTSLIEGILREVPALVLGERNPDRSQLWRTGATDVYKAIAEDLNPETPCRIWDRLYFSELVYAPVMKRPCCFTGPAAAYTARILVATRALVIWCMPGLATVEQNVAKTTQHPWVAGNTLQIYAAYAQLHSNWMQRGGGARGVTYSYHRHSTLNMLEPILQHLDERREMIPRETH